MISWADTHYRTALFALVFTVYIPCWLFLPGDITIVGNGDAREYIELARSISWGKEYLNFYRAPLYPFLLALPLRLFGENLFILRLINAFFHAFTLWLLFELTAKMLTRRAAWIFAFLFLFYPHFIYQSANILIESLFMFLVAWSVSLLYRDSTGTISVVPAGLVSGLALLARPNYIIVIPFIALYIFGRHFQKKELLKSTARGAIKSLTFVILTFMTISPWTYFNYLRSGGATILVTTGGGYNFWLGNSIFAMEGFFIDRGRELGGYLGVNPQETRLARLKDRIHPEKYSHPFQNIGQIEQEYYYQSLQSIRSHPFLFAKLYAAKFLNALRPWSDPRIRYDENIIKIFVTTVSYTPVFIIGLIGMFTLCLRKKPGAMLLAMMIVSSFAFLVLFFPSQRFRVPLSDPYLLIFTSYLIDSLIKKTSANRISS